MQIICYSEALLILLCFLVFTPTIMISKLKGYYVCLAGLPVELNRVIELIRGLWCRFGLIQNLCVECNLIYIVFGLGKRWWMFSMLKFYEIANVPQLSCDDFLFFLNVFEEKTNCFHVTFLWAQL